VIVEDDQRSTPGQGLQQAQGPHAFQEGSGTIPRGAPISLRNAQILPL
jgi:hypothetical protein